MRDFEVTKREVLVSIIIVLLMVSLGFFMSTSIHNKVSINSEKYFKALKVDNNPELFGYAIDTEVGGMLSYGTLEASNPVSDPLIDGEYFSMVKIEQHYVQKIRTVTYTDSDGNTRTKTETYWEWDEVKRERFNTDTFNYLGREFDYKLANLDMFDYSYNDTIKDGFFSRVRWKFYTIPKEFNASIYSKAESKTIIDNEIYINQTIESLIAKKEKRADHAVTGFWIGWSIVILIAVVGFVAMDNRFINAKSSIYRRNFK